MTVTTGMLPMPVRARLISAAKQPRELRAMAIDEAYAWARTHFPEYFKDAGDFSDVKPERNQK